MALVRKRVATMAPQHNWSSPACVMTTTAAARRRCWRWHLGIIGHPLLVQQQWQGCGVNNGTLALLVVPCSREHEGNMLRGNATAILCVVRGGGARWADARQGQRDKKQCNNQPAGRGGETKSDATTSQGEGEANGRQEAEAAHREAASQEEWRDKRWHYNQPAMGHKKREQQEMRLFSNWYVCC